MEFIGLIIVFLVLRWLWGAITRGEALSSNGTWPNAESTSNQFSARALKIALELEGTALAAVSVDVKGPISAPREAFPVKYVVHVVDITSGESKPVFCALDSMQAEDTALFEYRTESSTLPYQHTLISDWIRICVIPIDMLTLPHSGLRTIEVSVEVVAAYPTPRYVRGTRVAGVSLAVAIDSLFLEWNQPGYEEIGEQVEKSEELIVKLAMAVSASDGHMDPAEGRIIRTWLAKRIEMINDPVRKRKEKERLNKIVVDAYSAANDRRLDMELICKQLQGVTDAAGHYDALELCLHVAAADGKAEPEELKMIRRLGELMGVSLDRLRSLESKILPVTIHVGEADDDSLLGIIPGMSADEIRKHINREYKKWNALASHPDDAKKGQARQMLQRIAAARRKHVA